MSWPGTSTRACGSSMSGMSRLGLQQEAPRSHHAKYLYAGTLDLIADMRGERWLLDWKTSASGAYGDTAFQLGAYRYATHLLDTDPGPDGVVIPMPPVDRCGVIWLRADGYDLYPYHVDQAVFRQFLYVQQVAKAAADSRDYKGDALMPPVRSAS